MSERSEEDPHPSDDEDEIIPGPDEEADATTQSDAGLPGGSGVMPEESETNPARPEDDDPGEPEPGQGEDGAG